MSTALYNRYRPATFSQVVGQEHVTSALMQALRTGRLHHAYLFSGPRGCGKTSSARILAASLNCEKGPTPDPCGVCDQCVSIRTGSSMDVTEIDAASHGLVDDARDLRERAFFAPASARFKIFVVDEAHMVTAAAFNALLKVVEEPPSYLKFVFATTEPDKVIATIRSRTHHYAFRLVPPGVLRDHLASVAAQEGVDVDPAVLPLVVRAGAGSVRDSLSVLDQLLAGAGSDGLRYDRAVALLGMTDGVLLDETVDALAARDGATLFTVVDKVVGSGHDPRRFTADLLDRMRDLIMIKAVPDAVERGLLDAFSADQIERMKAQAGRVGPAELSRTADVLHAGLAEMRGTASPRLLLELVVARALLPAAAAGDPAALLTRLERLERGLAAGPPPAAAAARAGGPLTPAGPGAPDVPPAPARPPAPAAEPAGSPRQDTSWAQPPAAPAGPMPAPAAQPSAAQQAGGWSGGPSTSPGRPGGPPPPAPQTPPAPQAPAPQAPAAQPAVAQPAPAAAGGEGAEAATVRAVWDQVLAATRRRKQTTFALLTEYASVLDARGGELFLAFSAPRIAQMFGQGSHIDVLCEALAEQLGGGWRVTIGEPGGGRPAGGSRGGPNRPPVAPSGGGFPSASGGRPNPTPPPNSTPRPPAGFTPATPGGGLASQTSGGFDTAASLGGGAPSGLGTGGAAALGGYGSGGGPGGGPVSSASGPAVATAVRGPLGPGLDASAGSPHQAQVAPGAGHPGIGTSAYAHQAGASLAGAPSGGGIVPLGGHLGGAAPAAADLATAGVAAPSTADEPSLDDDDAPAHAGSTLSGEAAAMELLRVGLGATVMEQRGAS
ncbi:DNA polymerase III subunit gamma and tau [Pseudofrankia inefficax]|uniref:DNA-directed DNA polymerase n=1 Tax=Pseudofrankia inefficax (strain DSM 45817 / CECT 9037 / DDB 130130 / EuI1c) TaxID=298654 RepID=E3IUL8_PSEI1|nr:DNA polymerase III subunit gamma and tau [Pseudofrankia inefficax]ADP84834.1 DNA polymerase III, subunits gamma and tau [Pseudofrankia inefficax]